MLNQMIENILNAVKEKYPHIESPAAMKATITSVKKTDEKYMIDVTIKEKDTGETKECTIEHFYYVYTVKPIGNTGDTLSNYPAIPNVKSKETYTVGSTVTIAFTGGELYPAIIGG